jgi:hypothetical protein
MNMWRGKGQAAITVESLLGPDFVRGHVKQRFKTKEEWEKHKAEVTKMAKWHSRILKQIKAGTRPAKQVMDLNILERDAKGPRKK